MWIFTKQGFFSATLSTTKRGHIQVHARRRADLEALVAALPDELKQSRIIEAKESDYRWHIVMTPSKWMICLMKLSEEIDYSNFKSAAHQAGHDMEPIHKVWATMMGLQEEERKAEQARWSEGALPGLKDWKPNEERTPLR